MKRRGITRMLLIRGPSTASIAGNNVRVATTETTGINIPPMPIERSSGSGKRTIANRPTATVVPEMITERPAGVTVSPGVDADAGRKPGCRYGADLPGAALYVEPSSTRQIHLQERCVPVLRHVHQVACREVRARERAGTCLHDPRYRRTHCRASAEVGARG